MSIVTSILTQKYFQHNKTLGFYKILRVGLDRLTGESRVLYQDFHDSDKWNGSLQNFTTLGSFKPVYLADIPQQPIQKRSKEHIPPWSDAACDLPHVKLSSRDGRYSIQILSIARNAETLEECAFYKDLQVPEKDSIFVLSIRNIVARKFVPAF